MSYSYTKHQWVLLSIFTVTYLSSTIGLSLQGPFYPREAESKGVTASEYGFIFGIFYLVNFLVSPICGKLLTVVDPTIIAKLGIFVVAITTILFGFLSKLYDKTIFLALSYVIRIMEAYGFATFLTASYSIIAAEFASDIGTIGAVLETCLGTGLIIGPAIGGLLYELQGFLLPFLVVGILVLCASFITVVLLRSNDRYLSGDISSSMGMIYLLKRYEVILALYSVTVACLNFGFFHATLEPHIRSLNLSPSKNSLMFVVIGLAYSVTSIAWGRICDKFLAPQIIWSIGAILICISMILMGPAPYLRIPLSVPLCCVTLALMGIGQAAEIVSAFYCLNKIALKIGYPDDISTYGIVSSLFNMAFALGDFIGPTIGGFLLDNIGLPWGFHVVLFVHFLLFLGTLLYCLINKENVFPNPRIKVVNEMQEFPNEKMPLTNPNNIQASE